MRIVIQPRSNGYGFDSYELQRALDTLRDATIQTEGGALIGVEGLLLGVVILRAKADTLRALAVLKTAGMRASV
jgi:hypothetical protein